LFSKWYDGIQADDEGLYSATPEALADEMVQGLSGVVLDGTCGIGALAIAAARVPTVTHVVAVDNHKHRLEMAAKNARIYGVDERITFVHGRCEEQISLIEHDVLLLDPPWGGRDYDKQGMHIHELSINIEDVLAAHTGQIRMKLPRSFSVDELSGGWKPKAAVDDRGVIKFLVLERMSLSE